MNGGQRALEVCAVNCSLSCRVKQHCRLESPINMVRIMSFLPLNELPALFPHVVDWISYLEKQAQESGKVAMRAAANKAKLRGVFIGSDLTRDRAPLPSLLRAPKLAGFQPLSY